MIDPASDAVQRDSRLKDEWRTTYRREIALPELSAEAMAKQSAAARQGLTILRPATARTSIKLRVQIRARPLRRRTANLSLRRHRRERGVTRNLPKCVVTGSLLNVQRNACGRAGGERRDHAGFESEDCDCRS